MYSREQWIADHPDAHPNELPTPEKEAAILAVAKKAYAEGERTTYATTLGYRAYIVSQKVLWFAHGFWVPSFLASQGVAREPLTERDRLIWLKAGV